MPESVAKIQHIFGFTKGLMYLLAYCVDENIFLGVPACCAAQSACCGLRYRFGAVRTMLTHALRMPNAKEVFFCGFIGFTHPPAPE
jgi:hypothetical protein